MKITLTTEESENIFHNALCNGHQIAYYGLQLDYSEEEYEKARQRLRDAGESACLEDVWMEMLRGGATLTLVDEEGCEEPSTITLADVHARVSETPVKHLLDAINEEDDGITADVILQTVFYQDVIFC